MSFDNLAWLCTLSRDEAIDIMIEHANFYNKTLDTQKEAIRLHEEKISEYSERYNELRRCWELAKQTSQRLRSENDSLRRDNRDLLAELSSKDEELESMRAQANTSTTDSLQRDVKALRAELTSTQNELEKTRAKACTNDRWRQDATALRAELTATQNEVEKSRAKLSMVELDRQVAQNDAMIILYQRDWARYQLQRLISWNLEGSEKCVRLNAGAAPFLLENGPGADPVTEVLLRPVASAESLLFEHRARRDYDNRS